MGWFDPNGIQVTGITTTDYGNLSLTAHWIQIDYLPETASFIYDGTLRIFIDPAQYATYTSGTTQATNVGNYSVSFTLTSGHIWSDDTYDSTKTVNWSITARPLIVVSDSIWGTYTGEGYELSIPASAYTVFGLLAADIEKITITVSGTLSAPGILATDIDVTEKNGYGGVLDNYSVREITGTIIVTESAVSTVTVSNEIHAMGLMASPAIQAAVSPSGSRRWMI